MIGQLSDTTTVQVHDIDLKIAITTGAKGDVTTVGRDCGPSIRTNRLRESPETRSLHVHGSNLLSTGVRKRQHNASLIWRNFRRAHCPPCFLGNESGFGSVLEISNHKNRLGTRISQDKAQVASVSGHIRVELVRHQ